MIFSVMPITWLTLRMFNCWNWLQINLYEEKFLWMGWRMARVDKFVLQLVLWNGYLLQLAICHSPTALVNNWILLCADFYVQEPLLRTKQKAIKWNGLMASWHGIICYACINCIHVFWQYSYTHKAVLMFGYCLVTAVCNMFFLSMYL
jgi:hypothetical protein